MDDDYDVFDYGFDDDHAYDDDCDDMDDVSGYDMKSHYKEWVYQGYQDRGEDYVEDHYGSSGFFGRLLGERNPDDFGEVDGIKYHSHDGTILEDGSERDGKGWYEYAREHNFYGGSEEEYREWHEAAYGPIDG
jgi:hypothetical protein